MIALVDRGGAPHQPELMLAYHLPVLNPAGNTCFNCCYVVTDQMCSPNGMEDLRRNAITKLGGTMNNFFKRLAAPISLCVAATAVSADDTYQGAPSKTSRIN